MPRARRTIALLVDSLRSEYTALIWQAVKRAASARNVDTIAFSGERIGSPNISARTQTRIYELIGPNRFDGVIVVSSVLAHFHGTAGIADLCKRYQPLALCSIGLAVEGIPSLVVDNRGGMQLGSSHVLDVHRCRRPAFLAAQENSPESNLRLSGFRQALADRGIPFDERLVHYGNFTPESGKAAIQSFLRDGLEFDAVIAANDYMAMGALDVLSAVGRRVPNDIVVLGFDDISAAVCTQPSLSTLRQPMWWLANEAVDTVLRQLDGETVPAEVVGSIELIRRESCGCGFPATRSMQPPRSRACANTNEVIELNRADFEALMSDLVFVPVRSSESWPARLLDALLDELSGNEGRFVGHFYELLRYAAEEGANLDGFQQMITVLRAEVRRHPVEDSSGQSQLEHVWHAARSIVASSILRTVGRQRIDIQHATFLLGRSGERFATSMSLPLIRDALSEELPGINIDRAAISLFEAGFDSELKALVVIRDGQSCPVDDQKFDPLNLAPDVALESNQCDHGVVLPLTFQAEWIGVAFLSAHAEPNVYESLRQQIGSSIKVTSMHRQIVTQIAIRERLEQQRVTEEARMASEIQSSMAPKGITVAGLDIAHVTIPAAEAGGDYCDVLPDEAGAWIGIGDVTGHGLGAGLVMLMLQSMISSLVRSDREMLPSRMATLVNEALYDNVRHRLGRDDHATLTLLRYWRSGHVRFAGSHEPLVIYRAATQRCEAIVPPGFWVGAIPDVREQMQDAELQLHDGDLLVLYSDGAIEPRNAHSDQFGLERFIETIEANAANSVTQIRDQILIAVNAWSNSLDDDITLLVARYSAP